MDVIFKGSNLIFKVSKPILANLYRNGGLNNYANANKVSTEFLDCSAYAGKTLSVYTDRPNSMYNDEISYEYYYEMIFSSAESLIGTAPAVLAANLPGVIKNIGDAKWETLQQIPNNAICVSICINERVKIGDTTVNNPLRKEDFDKYRIGFRLE